MDVLYTLWNSKLLVGLLSLVVTAASVTTATHALLYKRDPRSATGWIGLSLLAPVAGPILYFLFGINRVRTRARKLKDKSGFPFTIGFERPEIGHPIPGSGEYPTRMKGLIRTGNAVARQPLVEGNSVQALHNGEECYPAMLEAIENARERAFLATYIFENNETGQKFVDALADAHDRGVDVRVIVDGIGEYYGFPPVRFPLRKRGVKVSRFLPPKIFPPSVRINLRNHRKLLVVDGRIGFTGGMNIGDRHLFEKEDGKRVQDAHFKLEGPVVSQLELVFWEDWAFSTGEEPGESSEPSAPAGEAMCRTCIDGPSEDLDQLVTILEGAIACAKTRVWIMTPYFLPPPTLVSALETAALRGVDVHVVLPDRNNLAFVDWATRSMLAPMIQRGVNVCYQPPPFAHTKLFLVDDYYAQIGSANLDPRSLRLNFELAVEVFEEDFNASLAGHFKKTFECSRKITVEELDNRALPIRLRDALFWLASPYL